MIALPVWKFIAPVVLKIGGNTAWQSYFNWHECQTKVKVK